MLNQAISSFSIFIKTNLAAAHAHRQDVGKFFRWCQKSIFQITYVYLSVHTIAVVINIFN